MKKMLTTLALLAAMMLPSSADAIIDDLLVRREGDHVNIRVNLHNPAATRQEGPVVVNLFVRANETDPWTEVNSWNDIPFIQPGYKISRDFFGANSPELQQLADKGRFQAKAVIVAPGLTESVEKTSWYNTQTGD